jgi:hypothetical protein
MHVHSTYWCLDGDEDDLPDLIGIGLREHEHAAPLEKNLDNAVYFYKNVGTRENPLFARPRRLKANDGSDLRADQVRPNMFPVDWYKDGDTDFFGTNGDTLLFWENAGQRDRDGLFMLKPPEAALTLDVSEFRQSLPGVVEKPAFQFRGARMVDWDGDGDLDLVAGLHARNLLRKANTRTEAALYGASLMFFEFFENVGDNEARRPTLARPVVIRDSRGLALTAHADTAAGPECVDWDNDGDLDLLFFDMTNRPLEGGRLMFAENDGTRDKPVFIKPIPILPISDGPTVADWNGDGRFDLIAGGELFENVNPRSGGRSPRRTPRLPSGTRLPHPESFPKLVSRGPARQGNP